MLKTTIRSLWNQYKNLQFVKFMVLEFRKREVSKEHYQAEVERRLREICDFSTNC